MSLAEDDKKPAAKKAARSSKQEAKFAERREIISRASIDSDVQYELTTKTKANGKVKTVAIFTSLFNQPKILNEWRLEDLRLLAVKFGLPGCKSCTKTAFGIKFAEAAYSSKKTQAAQLPRDMKQEGTDSDSTASIVAQMSTRPTQNCIIRLINVLFSDDFRGDFETLGGNKDRSVLDSGLAAGDEWFWGNVQSAYCNPDNDENKDFFGSVHVDHYAVKMAHLDPSKFQMHSWQTLCKMYRTLRTNYKKCHARLTTSGNGTSEFWDFCDNKVAPFYLYHMNKERGNASIDNSMLKNLPEDAGGQTTRDNRPKLASPVEKQDSCISQKKNNKFESLLGALATQGFCANSDPKTDIANAARAAMFEEQRSVLAMEKKGVVFKAYVESLEMLHTYKHKIDEIQNSTGPVIQDDVDHLNKMCKIYGQQEQEMKEEMEELKKKKKPNEP